MYIWKVRKSELNEEEKDIKRQLEPGPGRTAERQAELKACCIWNRKCSETFTCCFLSETSSYSGAKAVLTSELSSCLSLPRTKVTYLQHHLHSQFVLVCLAILIPDTVDQYRPGIHPTAPAHSHPLLPTPHPPPPLS